MATHKQTDWLPLLGGCVRNLAALVMVIGALVCFATAFATSWPLGPNYVDEGGITKVRLAIATLVAGQALAFGSVGFFIFDILLRIKRLADELAKSKENDP